MLDPATMQPDAPDWTLMEQDLLRIQQLDGGITIDVGWYPDENPSGAFAGRGREHTVIVQEVRERDEEPDGTGNPAGEHQVTPPRRWSPHE
jgi:hypothetical protein